MKKPLTDAELTEMQQWAMRYGPANGWSGSIGTSVKYVHRLLAEVKRLKKESSDELYQKMMYAKRLAELTEVQRAETETP